jgi:hypothetical protein
LLEQCVETWQLFRVFFRIFLAKVYEKKREYLTFFFEKKFIYGTPPTPHTYYRWGFSFYSHSDNFTEYITHNMTYNLTWSNKLYSCRPTTLHMGHPTTMSQAWCSKWVLFFLIFLMAHVLSFMILSWYWYLDHLL